MEKDHLTILLEDMNRKLDLVLEWQSALDKKMDTQFDHLKEAIDQNTYAIGVLNVKIDGVEETLNSKIDMVEEKLSNRIDMVEETLGKRIDTVEETLGKRIDTVEETLGKKIDVLAADLSAHRADTEAHHGVYRVKEL